MSVTITNNTKTTMSATIEVDFVFSDASDFLFSDGSTDYVFVPSGGGITNNTKA